MRGQDLPQAFHGEHIAVTTLTMARLQERMLARPVLELRPTGDTEGSMIATFGDRVGRECWRAFRAKAFDADAVDAINRRLAAEWPAIRERLRAVGRPHASLLEALAEVGAPTVPADVGLPPTFYDEAVANARLIRDRFTMLDLAALAGVEIAA
jgi:glycerol-1-phosphate dehydrogenase [NAD(P)+]